MLFLARHAARQAFDAVALMLFPSHIGPRRHPGNARVQAGSTVTVEARLVGNSSPVVAQLLRAPAGSEEWQPTEMETDGHGHFRLALSSLSTSFRYKVLAGFGSVGRIRCGGRQAAARCTDRCRVRLPAIAGARATRRRRRRRHLRSRRDEREGEGAHRRAGGDGTDAARRRQVAQPERGIVEVLTGSLEIAENGSYRVALADADGMNSRGDTEYFIRILDDRPPEVHVVRPASDRRVTRLEEVEIAAEAEDDFGVAALELVYAVRGGRKRWSRSASRPTRHR